MTRYEPKLEMPAGSVSPDLYDESIGSEPPDSFVVSRHRDGTVASRYRELAWNMSDYHSELKSHWLRFTFWGAEEATARRKQISHDAQWIMFALIWLREGASLSVGTLQNYMVVMKSLALHSDSSNCRMREILGDTTQLTSFVDENLSGSIAETLTAMLVALTKIGQERLGFNIVGDKLLMEFRARAQAYRSTLKQHAPIPTQIYSAIISRLTGELDDWLAVESEMLALLLTCAQNRLAGRTIEQQRIIAKESGIPCHLQPEFDELVTQKVKNYLLKKGLLMDVRGISRAVSEVQMVTKLITQTFTGMRDDEANSLPYHCLDESTSNGMSHCIVLGRTTKLNNGRIKRTKWVTNHDGRKAILTAQKIANTIYTACDVSAKKEPTRTNNFPLFVSVVYLGLALKPIKPVDGRFVSGGIKLAIFTELRTRIQPVIEDGDLCELEQIDLHRAWRSEKNFQVGLPWTLTSHQLRRSLALYAQRSGLVSLPSLRRQLQHITIEMSRYYARGSAFARDLISDEKNHFGKEWQETQPVSAAISYMLNVLLSDNVLFGGHANWAERRLKDASGTILINRETTIKRFKKGEMAYRETLIGGCTKVGECDQAALDWLDIDCISTGCRNMVGDLTKLERVIVAQRRLAESLDPASVEFRTEHADLNVLIAARDKVMHQQDGVFK